MKKNIKATVKIIKKVEFVATLPEGDCEKMVAERKVEERLSLTPGLDVYKIVEMETEDFDG